MKNKKIWKWLSINLLLIVCSASIISNATFIPKYYNLKKNSENETSIKVQISAIDDTSSKTLFTFNYQTLIINLGELMAQYKETYILTTSNYGRLIKGIKYTNENNKEQILENDNTNFWMIDYNKSPANVGIDGINLNTNDIIELHYKNFK